MFHINGSINKNELNEASHESLDRIDKILGTGKNNIFAHDQGNKQNMSRFSDTFLDNNSLNLDSKSEKLKKKSMLPFSRPLPPKRPMSAFQLFCHLEKRRHFGLRKKQNENATMYGKVQNLSRERCDQDELNDCHISNEKLTRCLEDNGSLKFESKYEGNSIENDHKAGEINKDGVSIKSKSITTYTIDDIARAAWEQRRKWNNCTNPTEQVMSDDKNCSTTSSSSNAIFFNSNQTHDRNNDCIDHNGKIFVACIENNDYDDDAIDICSFEDIEDAMNNVDEIPIENKTRTHKLSTGMIRPQNLKESLITTKSNSNATTSNVGKEGEDAMATQATTAAARKKWMELSLEEKDIFEGYYAFEMQHYRSELQKWKEKYENSCGNVERTSPFSKKKTCSIYDNVYDADNNNANSNKKARNGNSTNINSNHNSYNSILRISGLINKSMDTKQNTDPVFNGENCNIPYAQKCNYYQESQSKLLSHNKFLHKNGSRQLFTTMDGVEEEYDLGQTQKHSHHHHHHHHKLHKKNQKDHQQHRSQSNILMQLQEDDNINSETNYSNNNVCVRGSATVGTIFGHKSDASLNIWKCTPSKLSPPSPSLLALMDEPSLPEDTWLLSNMPSSKMNPIYSNHSNKESMIPSNRPEHTIHVTSTSKMIASSATTASLTERNNERRRRLERMQLQLLLQQQQLQEGRKKLQKILQSKKQKNDMSIDLLTQHKQQNEQQEKNINVETTATPTTRTSTSKT